MWGEHNKFQVAMFKQQFAREHGRWVYRRKGTGEAYPVTREERDTFIATFSIFLNRLTWSITGAIAALVLALAVPLSWARLDLFAAVFGIGFVLILLPVLLLLLRAFNAPQRALARRAAVAMPLSPAERERRWSDQVGWGAIGICGLALAVPLVTHLWGQDMLHGWGRLLLILPAAFTAFMAWLVWRKWRAGRDAS